MMSWFPIVTFLGGQQNIVDAWVQHLARCEAYPGFTIGSALQSICVPHVTPCMSTVLRSNGAKILKGKSVCLSCVCVCGSENSNTLAQIL